MGVGGVDDGWMVPQVLYEQSSAKVISLDIQLDKKCMSGGRRLSKERFGSLRAPMEIQERGTRFVVDLPIDFWC